MGLNWIAVDDISFNALMLLERVQIRWLPGWLPEPELGIALHANPAVSWFLQHRCPEIAGWVESLLAKSKPPGSSEEARQAELVVLADLVDLLVYALDPGIYDALPFLGWDDRELTDLVDFTGKTVIDVGAGTGRLSFVAARQGALVFAVEPVGNLREYLRSKAKEQGLMNFYAVDGLITQVPFPAHFADVTMGGHVFGDQPEAELAELERVTRSGGMVILCPGNNDQDNDVHAFLVGRGYAWGRFEEPGDGVKRKYWRAC
jgi:SAM-dependent methyltransferase